VFGHVLDPGGAATCCWYAGAGFGIGIATGPSRLVVLDLDPADAGGLDGAARLAALTAARGVQLAATFTVTTPRGGTHLYYRTPSGVRLRNTARRPAARRGHEGPLPQFTTNNVQAVEC
jgi:hypothetical protein